MIYLTILILSSVAMLGVWVYWLKTKKAEPVDVTWTLLVGLAGAVVLLCASPSLSLKIVLVVALVLLWSGRLAWHLFSQRVIGSHKDSRYKYMEEYLGERRKLVFFLFFQSQALSVVLLALTFYPVATSPSTVDHFFVIGLLLCLLSIAGESLADKQLRNFKHTAAKGELCTVGLWRYTRHPNYFFEWLYWCSWIFFAVGGDYFILSLVGPTTLYILLNYFTGIPPTENRMKERYGQKYQEYIKTTPAFFPSGIKTDSQL